MSVPGNGPPKQNPQAPPRNDGAGRGATGGAATPKNTRRPPPAEEGRGSASHSSASHTYPERGEQALTLALIHI